MDVLSWNAGEHSPLFHGAPGLPDASPTAALSNTVCILDPKGVWALVADRTVEALSEYGEIARLDSSLSAALQCVLVTYFDVRCTQRVLMQLAGRTESFPPAAHDCRIVRVNMAAFATKVGALGGFKQYGEVAHITMAHSDAIVEFYDMRSAQFLLAAAGGTASPWLQAPLQPAAAAAAAAALAALQPAGLPGLGGLAGLHGLGDIFGLGSLGGLGLPLMPSRVPQTPALTKAALTLSRPLLRSLSISEESEPGSPASDKGRLSPKAGERSCNRPVRTKVTTKEFQKYDIDPEKIQRGEDNRSTVMVRNLGGLRARKDFLTFLDKCGLGERYTFFYLPCKEHRNVPAGFAFVNFVSAADVHKLYVMVTSGFWRESISDPQSKVPAVSYARFQGHEELAKHFSSSAVLREQDPEKRPIFRPEAAKAGSSSAGASSPADSPKTPGVQPRAAGSPAARAQTSPTQVPKVLAAQPKMFPLPVTVEADGNSELHAALQRGARKIAEILRGVDSKGCTGEADDRQINRVQMGG